ncbi:hypothetical protein [Neochlamydia sp. EPS4]|uniref:hypothetical protein n=1 Tax=Neochlamydia sp. EPS4 TaxID=1478175 RepID=UPI0005D0F1E9|nr:hypothetical protein [Neochlamydia sp. EPS4]
MTSSTNSQNFLEDLNSIAGSYVLDTSLSYVSGQLAVIPTQKLYNTSTTSAATLNSNLTPANFNSIDTTDITSFINQFYTKVLGYPSTSSIPSAAYDPSNSASPLNGLYNIYTASVGANPDIGNTDLSSIIDVSNLPGQFKAAFSDFIKNFNFSILSSSSTSETLTLNGTTYTATLSNNYGNFTKAFLNYLSTTTVIQTSNKSSVLSLLNSQNSTGVTYVQSYQAIYESFNGPVGTLSQNSANWTVAQRVFVQRLSAFYTSELAKTATSSQPSGSFEASQDLGDWYSYTQNLYYNPQFSPTALTRDSNSTYILNEVLLALISMLGTIQNVAASQSQTLSFLSQWQAAYSDKLRQMRTFTQGDGTVLGGTNDWDKDAAQATRNALNNVNQNYISKLQASQQTLSDQAKSLQANVNQSNDAASQQGSVADSILQQLSTILSAIFK